MNNDILSLIFAATLLFFLIGIFIRIALMIRKRGGGMATTMYGSTYEMYDSEKRAAIEQVLEQKVKKLEEQDYNKPIN